MSIDAVIYAGLLMQGYGERLSSPCRQQPYASRQLSSRAEILSHQKKVISRPASLFCFLMLSAHTSGVRMQYSKKNRVLRGFKSCSASTTATKSTAIDYLQHYKNTLLAYSRKA